jgi:3-hydroxyacyl-CoA dehydrogenase
MIPRSTMSSGIKRVAVVGTGVIGASWTALFLARGLRVSATDIAPGAEERLRRYVETAWPALESLGVATGDYRSQLSFTPELLDAVAEVDLVQESGPERLDMKQALYRELDSRLPPEVIIASSSSGLTMSDIQSGCERYPERCVIGHPFNPPHLIPLVEIVGGAKTSEATVTRITRFYEALGKKTIRLHKEVAGHVANRLQAALFREVVHLVSEGVVDVGDVDKAVCWGPGLRWAVMGPALLFHLGGGAGGIEHFFDQFTQPMNDWWAALGKPQITTAIRDLMIQGTLREAGARSIDTLVTERDAALLGLLRLRAGQP